MTEILLKVFAEKAVLCCHKSLPKHKYTLAILIFYYEKETFIWLQLESR